MEMDFGTFKTFTVDALQVHYGPENVEVTFHEVTKINDQKQTGIMIKFPKLESNTDPVIYIDEDYREISEGKLNFDSFINKLICCRDQYTGSQLSDAVSLITFWENAKNHVYPMLVSAEKNKQSTTELVHKDYLDLSIIYILRDIIGETRGGSVRITKKIFRQYGITMEELHRAAMDNLKKDGYSFYSLSDLMFCISDEIEGIQPVEHFGDELYCLTNKKRMFGAAGILDLEMIEKAADGRDVYAIPSSIHELLFLRPNEDVTVESINQIIQEINKSSVVTPGDVLSDHVYYYSAAEREIRIAA